MLAATKLKTERGLTLLLEEPPTLTLPRPSARRSVEAG